MLVVAMKTLHVMLCLEIGTLEPEKGQGGKLLLKGTDKISIMLIQRVSCILLESSFLHSWRCIHDHI